jgi:hypothetical protein
MNGFTILIKYLIDERIHNTYKVFDRFDIEEKRVIHFTYDSKKMYFSSKVSPVRDEIVNGFY